jgi:hypothetical protein
MRGSPLSGVSTTKQMRNRNDSAKKIKKNIALKWNRINKRSKTPRNTKKKKMKQK